MKDVHIYPVASSAADEEGRIIMPMIVASSS
jgi:hypothetical protein